MTITKELEFREWIQKITERLRLILYDIKSKTDLAEEDWEILRFFHRIYWMGDIPFHKTKTNLTDKKTVQRKLFNDKTSVTADGTPLDYLLPNLNE